MAPVPKHEHDQHRRRFNQRLVDDERHALDARGGHAPRGNRRGVEAREQEQRAGARRLREETEHQQQTNHDECDRNRSVDVADPARIGERVEQPGERTRGAAQVAGCRPPRHRLAQRTPRRLHELEVALIEEVPSNRGSAASTSAICCSDDSRSAAPLMRASTITPGCCPITIGRPDPSSGVTNAIVRRWRAQYSRARSTPPTKNAVASASAVAASSAIALALNTPRAGHPDARIDHVSVAHAVDLEVLLAGAARAEAARVQAKPRQRTIGDRRRPQIARARRRRGASTLLVPAESTAVARPPPRASAPRDRARSPCRCCRGSVRAGES